MIVIESIMMMLYRTKHINYDDRILNSEILSNEEIK